MKSFPYWQTMYGNNRCKKRNQVIFEFVEAFSFCLFCCWKRTIRNMCWLPLLSSLTSCFLFFFNKWQQRGGRRIADEKITIRKEGKKENQKYDYWVHCHNFQTRRAACIFDEWWKRTSQFKYSAILRKTALLLSFLSENRLENSLEILLVAHIELSFWSSCDSHSYHFFLFLFSSLLFGLLWLQMWMIGF